MTEEIVQANTSLSPEEISIRIEEVRKVLEKGKATAPVIRNFLSTKKGISDADLDIIMVTGYQDRIKKHINKGADPEAIKNSMVKNGIVSTPDSSALDIVNNYTSAPFDETPPETPNQIPEEQDVPDAAELVGASTAVGTTVTSFDTPSRTEEPKEVRTNVYPELIGIMGGLLQRQLLPPEAQQETVQQNFARYQKLNRYMVRDMQNWYKGIGNPDYRERVAQQKEISSQAVIRDLNKQGFKVFEDDQGTLKYTTDEGVDEELTSDILTSIYQEKFELIGASVGAYKGLQYTKGMPKTHQMVAATVGAVVGSIPTAMTDNVINTLKLRESLDLYDNLVRSLSAAQYNAVAEALGWPVIAGLGFVGKQAAKGMKKVTDYLVNLPGAGQAIEMISGYSKNQLARAKRAFELASGGPSTQKNAVDQEIEHLLMSDDLGPLLVTPRALKISKKGGAHALSIADQIDQRFQQLYGILEEGSDPTLKFEIPDLLNAYVNLKEETFNFAKDQGAKLVQGKYAFDYDKIALEPFLNAEYNDIIQNPAIQTKMYNVLVMMKRIGQKSDDTLVDQLGNLKQAGEEITKEGKEVVKSTKVGKLSDKAAEAKAKQIFTRKTVAIDEQVEILNRKLTAARNAIDNNPNNKSAITAAKNRIKKHTEAKKVLAEEKRKLTRVEKLRAAESRTQVTDEAVEGSVEQSTFKEAGQQVAEGVGATEARIAATQQGQRTFKDLLNLREAVNKLKRNDFLIPDGAGRSKIKTILSNIDDEIKRVSKEEMGEGGEQWHKDWLKSKSAISNSFEVRENTLFKLLTNPDLSPEEVMPTIAKFFDNDNVFRQVMAVLSPKKRKAVEGTFLYHLATSGDYTVSPQGIRTAVDFRKLWKDVERYPMEFDRNKALKQVIKVFEGVHNNDARMLRELSIMYDISDPNNIALTVAGKAKMKAASSIYTRVLELWPTSKERQLLALSRRVAKVLDNPAHHRTLKEFYKDFKQFPEIIDMIDEFRFQYGDEGIGKTWDTAKVYSFNSFKNAIVPKGDIKARHFTSLDGALAAAKRAGGKQKVIATEVIPQRIATMKDIESMLGHELTPDDLLKPDIMESVKNRFDGIKNNTGQLFLFSD